MKVYPVQLNMLWQDKAHNLARVEKLVSSLEAEPGSLIVLPEMFATGFSMQVDVTAQTTERESEELLRRLASKTDCCILGGVVSPSEDGQAANEAVAFAPNGDELVRYRKQQPFSMFGEGEKYPAGEVYKIFHWHGIKISPFICYDLRFPELFRPAALAGAELIVVIACWPAVRSEHWVRLLQARSIENLAAVVGVNRCGEEPNLTFDGRSTGFDHLGNQLFEFDSNEQTASCEIDIGPLRKWRETFPALRDAKRV
ncbi:MAG TPA: amidohydrolase [Planctomycetaceae bacterium]|nr:amidohydrolase [Planctomycetaceae bacterium]